MREHIERRFATWGRFVFRNAKAVLSFSLLVAAALATQLPSVTLDTSTENFLKKNDPVRTTYDEFRSQFGRDERVALAIRPPEVFDLHFLETLRDFHADIVAEVPKLQDVQSLINARDTRGEGDRLIVEELFADWPETPAELAAIRDRALANPLYKDLVISADGSITTIMIETDVYSSIGTLTDELAGFDDDAAAGFGTASKADQTPVFLTGEENREIVDALDAVVARYQSPDFEIFMAGAPIMIEHMQKVMMHDMLVFTSLSLFVIAALLALIFQRLAGILVPLLVAGLTLSSAIATMSILNINISLPIQILPSFLLSVGVGGSLHLLAIFYQERRRGADKERAIAFTLGHSGLAIAMTCLTTAGGLASFSAAELAPIADFGISATIGVLFCLFFTLTVAPALISLLPMRSAAGTEGWGTHFSNSMLRRCGEFSVRHAWSIVISTAGILAVAGLGAAQLRFSHNPLKWFPEDDYFRVSAEMMNEELKGSMYLEVLVDTGEENGLHDAAVMRGLDEMRIAASSLQRGNIYVGKTVSLADILKETHKALNGNQDEFYAIPSDRALIAQELLLFENSGSDDIEKMTDSQFRVGRFTIKLPFEDAMEYEGFMELLEDKFRVIMGPNVTITTTGLMALLSQTFSAVTYSMAKTYIAAFVIITPMMMFLVGSVRMGLISMIPNLAPILITIGIMGWAGVPLDLFTLLIGCIAIGLAVDDTIHFMHNFRRYYEQSRDVNEAVRDTLLSTGQAMLFTTLTLSMGFFIYMLASMTNMILFGLLTGFTILMAFIADVVLAPALMALVASHTSLGRFPAPEPAPESLPSA